MNTENNNTQTQTVRPVYKHANKKKFAIEFSHVEGKWEFRCGKFFVRYGLRGGNKKAMLVAAAIRESFLRSQTLDNRGRNEINRILGVHSIANYRPELAGRGFVGCRF